MKHQTSSASPNPDSPHAERPAEQPTVRELRRRRRRRDRPRSQTIAARRLTREEMREGATLAAPVDQRRPQTRSACREGARPCPYVSCKYHLFIDVNPDTGSLKLNFPDLDIHDLPESCALDVADRGGITLEEIGEIMNLTRERVRQVEVLGLMKLKTNATEEEMTP